MSEIIENITHTAITEQNGECREELELFSMQLTEMTVDNNTAGSKKISKPSLTGSEEGAPNFSGKIPKQSSIFVDSEQLVSCGKCTEEFADEGTMWNHY